MTHFLPADCCQPMKFGKGLLNKQKPNASGCSHITRARRRSAVYFQSQDFQGHLAKKRGGSKSRSPAIYFQCFYLCHSSCLDLGSSTYSNKTLQDNITNLDCFRLCRITICMKEEGKAHQSTVNDLSSWLNSSKKALNRSMALCTS